MPCFRRKLAGDDSGERAAAIVEELEQIVALGIGERREAEIVQEEDVEASELAESADVGAVGASQSELGEEPWGAAVQSAVAFAASLLGERTGDVGFADAGCAGEDDVGVFFDPAAGGELADLCAIEVTAAAVVDVLDAGLSDLELRLEEEPLHSLVLAVDPLGVDEQAEAFVEVQLFCVC